MPARDASTGEQKALLIGLVLAHAALVAEMTGIVPLLLLDEVVAHLDPNRRRALFYELAKLGAQVWMTGADPAAFTDIGAIRRDFRRGVGPDHAPRLSGRLAHDRLCLNQNEAPNSCDAFSSRVSTSLENAIA